MNKFCRTKEPSVEEKLEVNRRLNLYRAQKVTSTRTTPILIPVCIYVKSDPISNTEITDFIDSLNNYFNGIDPTYSSSRDFLNTYTYTGGQTALFNKIKTQYNAFYNITGTINVFFYLKTLVKTNRILNVTYNTSENIIKQNLNGVNDVPIINYGKTLNVWFVNFIDDTLGYAYYPSYIVSTYPQLDGIVLERKSIISSSSIPTYNLNKAAVHEIGHWLELIHPFEEPFEEDYVSDTPPNDAQIFPNPFEFPPPIYWPRNTNGDLVMFINYMDYTNDYGKCMFSQGQCSRMNAALGLFRPLLKNYIPLTAPTITISITKFKIVGPIYYFNNTSVIKLTHNFVDRNDGFPNTIILLKNNAPASNTLYTTLNNVITVKSQIANTGTFKIQIQDILSAPVYSNEYILTYVDIPTVSNIKLTKGILTGTITNTTNKLVTVTITIRRKKFTLTTYGNIRVNVISANLIKKNKYTFTINTNNTVFTASISKILTY
jgi:hypothetical protein